MPHMTTLTPAFTCDEPPVSAWSFSRLKEFERCPHATYLKAVERSPIPPREPDHPAERGTRIHKEAEDYVRGDLDPLPKSLEKFRDHFLDLREQYQEGRAHLECEWAFTDQWEDTGWWADNCWARIKPDAVVLVPDESMARVIDHKTGKAFRKSVAHAEQGQTYVIATFLKYPEIDLVQTEFWYLDVGRPVTRKYPRSMLPTLMGQFGKRALALTEAVRFAPTPSRMACKYCDFGPRGTGACEYSDDSATT